MAADVEVVAAAVAVMTMAGVKPISKAVLATGSATSPSVVTPTSPGETHATSAPTRDPLITLAANVAGSAVDAEVPEGAVAASVEAEAAEVDLVAVAAVVVTAVATEAIAAADSAGVEVAPCAVEVATGPGLIRHTHHNPDAHHDHLISYTT